MANEREDLEQLLHSDGWRVFREHAAKEWGTEDGGGARFLQAVRTAAAAGDADATALLRQIVAAQREIHALLAWVPERLKQLKQAETRSDVVELASRRGRL